MTDERMITYLNAFKKNYSDGEIEEVIDAVIEAIRLKKKILSEIDKAIEKEKTTLDQFTDDFNHHLWIMRGLQIAKAIVEGEDYKNFTS
jgi:hypothetical protein